MGDLKILLTGATGFLGKHLLRELYRNNYTVIVLVRKSSNIDLIKQYTVNTYFVEDGLEKIFIDNQIDGIIHTATAYGQNGCMSEVYDTNVLFPIKLLELCIKYQASFFINTDTFFTKSFGEYSYLNNYTNSKKLLVELSEQFAYKVCVINLKLEHVYGEDDNENKFISQIIKRLSRNDPMIDLTNGLQKRDFVYIKDVVDSYLLVIKNLKQFKNGLTTIEVGTGNSISIKEAVDIIHRKSQSSSKLNYGVLPTRVGEFKESKANNEVLKSMGWSPKYNFEEGIASMLENNKL